MVFYGYVDYTSDGRPFYVGKGKLSRVRLPKRNRKHGRVSAKYGRVRVVEYASKDETAVLEWEVSTIAGLCTYRTRLGCNFTKGGDGTSEWVPGEETRAKISAANRGRVPGEETRAKMSKAQTGRVHSPETRAKIGNYHRGKKKAPESCLKMSVSQRILARNLEHLERLSVSHRGKKLSPEHIAKLAAAGLGRKHSPETLAKMSASASNRSQEYREKQSVAQRKRWEKERQSPGP